MTAPDQKPTPRWSSRKFAACMFWQTASTGLLVYGYIPPEVYLQLTVLTLGGYFLGNVAQKVFVK